jgi:predicted phosphodiesterase
MSVVTWLHLSDLHQTSSFPDDSFSVRMLLEDIRDRVLVDRRLANIDFIIFAGDVATTGQHEEYQQARSLFFEPLLALTGVAADNIFFVPGNHDINRHTVYEMLPPELQCPFETDTLVRKWFLDHRKRQRLLEPFESYTSFVHNFSGQPSPDYASSKLFRVSGKTIGVLGLNSAIMSGRGSLDERWKLIVGEPQVNEGLGKISKADLQIAVLHHPFDWLSSFERRNVEARINTECHLVLHGHLHGANFKRINAIPNECVSISSGLIRDSADSEHRVIGYNYVQIDLNSGEGLLFLRRWSKSKKKWMSDTNLNQKGRVRFKVDLLSGISKPTYFSYCGSSCIDLVDPKTLLMVEKVYRDKILLESDIIDLANLPEQDRNVAQKQQNFKLRSLYIPLRCRLDFQNEERLDSSELKPFVKIKASTVMSGGEFGDIPKELGAPIGQLLRHKRRLLVLGDPGAGKTTLLRYLATAYLLRSSDINSLYELPDSDTLPAEDWLPIMIRCRELKLDVVAGPVETLFLHNINIEGLSISDNDALNLLLQQKIQSGNALILIDGLDEIADPVILERFCKHLELLVAAYPTTPIIATSRTVGYRDLGYRLEEFQHISLTELSSEEKDVFATRWCNLTELPERRKVAIHELIQAIHSTERIERLTSNPMLLTTVALLKPNVGKLPLRRADLYAEAVQVLLNWRHEFDEPIDSREAIPQLEYLAYVMCDQGVQQLRYDEVVECLSRMREEYPNIHAAHNRSVVDFIKLVESRTGIFLQAGHSSYRGRTVPVYNFRHLTFQEYLAARALVDGRFPGRNPKSNLAAHISPIAARTSVVVVSVGGDENTIAENWREPLRLCVAICSDDDVDSVLLGILASDEDGLKITRARATLAALCLADEPNVSNDVAKAVLSAVAAHVDERDAAYSSSQIASMVHQVAATRWADLLRRCLLAEYLICHPERRPSLGSLAGIVSMKQLPREKQLLANWFQTQIPNLYDKDDIAAVDVALTIMTVAFRKSAVIVPGLIDALLKSLYRNPCQAFASAWALGWLNLRDYWTPTNKQADSIIRYLSDTSSDYLAVRFLLWIVKKERLSSGGNAISQWADHFNSDVRHAAERALSALRKRDSH